MPTNKVIDQIFEKFDRLPVFYMTKNKARIFYRRFLAESLVEVLDSLEFPGELDARTAFVVNRVIDGYIAALKEMLDDQK